MVIIHRAANLASYPGSMGNIGAFSDAGLVSDWAVDAARWNVGSGLISGRGGGILAPTNSITRAETATIVLNLLRKAGLVDVRDGQPPV